MNNHVTPEVRALCDEVARFLRKEVDPRSREIEESDAPDLWGISHLFRRTIFGSRDA